jgi:hypothetical protein
MEHLPQLQDPYSAQPSAIAYKLLTVDSDGKSAQKAIRLNLWQLPGEGSLRHLVFKRLLFFD